MGIQAAARFPTTTPNLAQQLASLEALAVPAFLRRYGEELDSTAAWELKTLFDDYESSDPERAIAVAGTLGLLGEQASDPLIGAVAAWVGGMAAQLEGDLPASLAHLERAETVFTAQGEPVHAAATLISKLFSLAMLGRYDEALRTGLRARAAFLRAGDWLAAGKVEQNLGNIYFRRDEYRKAEQLYRTARKRFMVVDDPKQLAQIDNCLASALTWQHQFQAALAHYDQALARAADAGLEVTQAEIESNLGGLMLFQGRYDRALDFLERARRRYAGLGLEQDAAISEKELAEAYLELNLIPEALDLLQKLLPTFEDLGMQADLAASFIGFARACVGSRRLAEAEAALVTARGLYAQEQNALGLAYADLVDVQRLLALQEFDGAIARAEEAEAAFAHSHAWEPLLRLRTLRAEAHALLGAHEASRPLFEHTLAEAQARGYPQIELRCLVALGAQALAAGSHAEAQRMLDAALHQFESLRATLPSEEFRLSFRRDQASLFDGLIALALAAGDTPAALQLVERARSHTLLELVDRTIPTELQPRDAHDAQLLAQLAERRREWNWFYHQLSRAPIADEPPSDATLAQLQQGAREREQEIATLVRRLQQRSGTPAAGTHPAAGTSTGADASSTDATGEAHLALAALPHMLGDHSVLVEYYALHGRLLAFVISGEATHVVELGQSEDGVARLVRQLRFQIDTLRNGSEHVRRHLDQLTARTNQYLRELYAALLEPVAHLVKGRRLVIVPFGTLHYVPFHALRSLRGHVIEEAEVCVAPSAGILHRCLQQSPRPAANAVLIGAPDDRTPLLAHEIAALHALMPQAQVRLGSAATVDAVRTLAPAASVLHLACHGHFRPDNPMFSALHLADGLLTARDAYDLDLHHNCSLVTLSACETGINAVTQGDELLGLVRGFLTAGAPALLVSLWPVDDATTVEFMQRFYTAWLGGAGLAEAHRAAQRALLAAAPHPFYWSPFVLYGRW
jgi:CHAT domain-containing protein